MQYSRVLGAPGGDISQEVSPNSEFDALWLRFLASLYEFDRSSRLSEIVDRGAPRVNTAGLNAEQVRKAGRDFGANVSLYGWANTHFAARRLRNHIRKAWSVLRLPEIQNVYGAFSPLQVIERVAQQELGGAPNIVRYRTLAESGQAVIDLVATYSKAWTRAGDKPLMVPAALDPPPSNGNTYEPIPTDIPAGARDDLLRHAGYILAVNGVGEDEIAKQSEARVVTGSPSLPALSGSPPGDGSVSNGTVDQLRQMMAQGRTPSLEELQGLISTAGVGVNGGG